VDIGDPRRLHGAALANLVQAQAVLGIIGSATQTYRELARLGQEGVIRSVPSALLAAWPGSKTCREEPERPWRSAGRPLS
jgi:hypothetical protein